MVDQNLKNLPLTKLDFVLDFKNPSIYFITSENFIVLNRENIKARTLREIQRLAELNGRRLEGHDKGNVLCSQS